MHGYMYKYVRMCIKKMRPFIVLPYNIRIASLYTTKLIQPLWVIMKMAYDLPNLGNARGSFYKWIKWINLCVCVLKRNR